MSRTVVWSVGIMALIGASSAAWAGGHGPMVRPGGFGGGGHMMHAMPPVTGTWHERSGRSFITGGAQPHPGFGFGHTNTASAAGRHYGGYGYGHGSTGGLPQVGYFGHTRTASNNIERWRTTGVVGAPRSWRGRVGYGYRYGVADAGRFGVRFGHPRVAGRHGYGYGQSGYGGGYGDYGSTGGYSGSGGYAVPMLASQYAEPPLNYGGAGSGDYGVGAPGEGSPSVAGTGGPQVIVVNNNYGGSGCNCHAVRSPGPVVYRYGVGTYY